MRETDNTANDLPRGAAAQDRGITTRLALVTLLTFTLLGAIRWAVDITNANAKRVSHNLTQMQVRMDNSVPAASGGLPRTKNNRTTRRKRSQDGAPQ